MTDAQFSVFLFHLMRQLNMEIGELERNMRAADLDMEARGHWLVGFQGLSDVLCEQAAALKRSRVTE